MVTKMNCNLYQCWWAKHINGVFYRLRMCTYSHVIHTYLYRWLYVESSYLPCFLTYHTCSLRPCRPVFFVLALLVLSWVVFVSFSTRPKSLLSTVYVVRREGYVLTRICLSTPRGVPWPGLIGGVPWPGPDGGGVPLLRGGTPPWVPPGQTWPDGVPLLQGLPHLGYPPRARSDGEGTPANGGRVPYLK